MRNNEPIAVIDSGVGGISVLSHLRKLMPNENFIYFGDSKNAPYGTKSKEEILKITRENIAFLLKRGVKAVVIACNTATSAAAKILRAEMPDLPIIGIEPALKPATLMFVNPRIIVMATPLTLKEEKFLALCEKFGGDSEIIPLPCGGLVEIIESGETDGPRINLYLESIFAPFKDERIDALVLGCTHYPHIISAIRRYIPKETVVLDGGEGTARETYRRLFIADLLSESDCDGQVEIINTSGKDEMIDLSWRLLGR